MSFPDQTAQHGDESDDQLVNTSILIVGGGPTGLFMAYLLKKLDIPSILVEKYPERLAAPKAHALSPRSLEICRQFGLDTKRIRGLGTSRDDAKWVRFVTNLAGEQVGVLPYERMDPDVLLDTPEMIHNIPQPRFEEFIADELRRSELNEIWKGVGFVSCCQDEEGVTSVVQDRGTKKTVQVRSKYVIGSDGAKSAVRNHLGISSTLGSSEENLMTIHFKADIRPILGDRIGMLHWILDPAVSGFIISYDPSGDMVLIANFDPVKHPANTWTEHHCREVLKAAFGCDIAFQVLSYRPWILSQKNANKYRSDRVFLAGDAAHSFPPTGGLGLNCGLADVHNLAWKLAFVLKGYASDSLLGTYELERRPVAELYARQSATNGKKIFSFLKTIGTANMEDLDEARKKLLATIHDPSKQADIKDGIESHREHFDNLELHIGYVYNDGYAPTHASKYSPKFCVGARLPHSFIRPIGNVLAKKTPLDLSYVPELSRADMSRRRYSTLDLCSPNAFTLILGVGHTPNLDRSILRSRLMRFELGLNIFVAGADFEITEQAHSTLFDQHITCEGGGFLVRPDQHILLCIYKNTATDNVTSAIRCYLRV